MIAFVVMRPPTAPLRPVAPTTQDVAIVMGSGGHPFAEYEAAKNLCLRAGKNVSIFAGNDMIQHFPDNIDHAVTLHPDKLNGWLSARRAAGLNAPPEVWAHTSYFGNVTRWSRDWSGSTGLFCIKVARENGFVHIIACGVHMDTAANHFIRKDEPWEAATGFLRGWEERMDQLKPYLRSMGGWTQKEFGAPNEDWLRTDIVEQHRTGYQGGLKA